VFLCDSRGEAVVAYLKAQVVLQHGSGDPERNVVNTLHFNTSDTPGGPYNAVTAVMTGITSMYNQFGMHLWGAFSRTESHVNFYDMGLPKPNPPIDVRTLALPSNASVNHLPGEVAACISYFSAAPAGVPPARRRGRLYAGPFSYGTVQDFAEVPSLFRTALNAGGNALLSASNADGNWSWITFSPTQAGGWALPGGTTPPDFASSTSNVLGGWVDSAWDTQRSRGTVATTRSTFGVTQGLKRAALLPADA
jgi:hypothetical protein